MKTIKEIVKLIIIEIESNNYISQMSVEIITKILFNITKPFKDSIIISKEEYLDLLEDKLLISNYNYNSFDINDEEYDKIKQEIQEKIDYLKLL